MQVNSSANARYYASYQRNTNVKSYVGFTQTENSGGIPNAAAESSNSVKSRDSQDFLRTWMSQETECDVGAVTIAESEDKGEFLGLTMIPEKGQSMTYGMRAMLPEQSTPDNPIVQVISNLGGKKEIYNVDVSKVNPQNATQLEMFALLSYTDKMGTTDGGTFGSFHQLKVYAFNASENGYCGSLSGGDVFLNEKFDWSAIMEDIMKDYLKAGIYNQYENCNKLLTFFDMFADKNKESDEFYSASAEKSEGLPEGGKATAEEINTKEAAAKEVVTEEKEDYQKLLKDKIDELMAKIQKGDTETTYQIGAQSFTEEEWNEFLESFDSVEEAIKELMKEEQEIIESKQVQKEQAITDDESSLLVAESTSCTYPAADSKEEDIRYLTWYTEEGIFCRKSGQTEGYEWSITLKNKEQYDKVMDFIGQFPSDWNMRFAACENFWTDFINDEIDMDGFMGFMEETNKGVPDDSLTIDDAMYIDKNKVQWAKYLNPLGGRLYTSEEMNWM